jgi:hypothetical protein
VSPFAARIATRTDVEFERALAQAPALKLVDDTPALGGGWFRLIRLVKDASGEEPTHPYRETAR